MPSNPDKVITSDTSCLIGLTNIGQINILRELYGSVIVTPEVMKEYGSPLPEWVVIQEVSDSNKIAVFDKIIGLGESSAIALALETQNSMLIVDDRRARQFALDLGLEIIGTLGLLIRAYENGIIKDIDSIVIKLREIGFRLPTNTEALIKTIKK
jgi:predicted nucleic acid-binding protein